MRLIVCLITDSLSNNGSASDRRQLENPLLVQYGNFRLFKTFLPCGHLLLA